MQKRDSSIELLRIVLMILIIMSHYSAHGGYGAFQAADFSWQVGILQILAFWGNIGNDVFLLITGYFLIRSEIKYQRIVRLMLEMIFYSWVMIIWELVSGDVVPAEVVKDLFKSLFPFLFGQSFAVSYLLLCCLVPSLNRMVRHLQKTDYKKLLVITLVLWSLVPTVTIGGWGSQNQFGSMAGFIILYLLGGYLRIYGISFRLRERSVLAAACVLLGVFVYGLDLLAVITGRDQILSVNEYFLGMNSVIVVMIAVAMFLTFQKIHFYNRWINEIAKSVFGIYLLHNSGMVQIFLWRKWMPNINYLNTKWFLPHLLWKAAVVFTVCLLIDKIRMYVFEKPVMNIGENIIRRKGILRK